MKKDLKSFLIYFFILLAAMLFSMTDVYAQTEVSGTIYEDTTWTRAGSPYIVTGNVFIYHSDDKNTATLSIEPGVEVRFDLGTGLYIGYKNSHYGALSAQGTKASPIRFTSNNKSPRPNDWRGIYFYNYTNDDLTLMEYCVVEYGGVSYNSNIYCASASPTIKNSKIRYSSACGIYLSGTSNPVIGGADSGNIISENGTYGIFSHDDATPYPDILYNTISNNGSYPIRVGAVMNVKGNTCSENGINAIEIIAEDINSNIIWENEGIPYVITNNISVYYSNDTSTATLTIKPGVELRFAFEKGLWIGSPNSYLGALSAQGTRESPIIFTSNNESPRPSDWVGIYFTNKTNNDLSIMDHCVIEYGGASYNSNIYCNSASPTIKNSTIRYSSGSGIFLKGTSNPVIGGEESGNIISENETYGIFSDNANHLPVIHNNTISNNGSYPIRVGAMMDVSGNTCSENGIQAIEVIGKVINEHTTWKNEKVPYIITGHVSVYYSDNNTTTITLTIEPGVNIRFDSDIRLSVGSNTQYGALSAKGTEESPIIFTSNAESPSSGDWKGIYFYDKANDNLSVLDHCIIEYGGHTYDSDIYLLNASPTIKNSTIRYSSGYGIYSDDSSIPIISDNILSDNAESPINIHPNSVKNVNGNSGSENGKDCIVIRAGTISSSCRWVKQGFPYVITGHLYIYDSVAENSTATLTIEPGVEFRFNSGIALFVGSNTQYGALSARGTEEFPIIFTSNAESPSPGDWKGIYFYDKSNNDLSILEHCVIEYGGYSYNSDIYLNNASPTIQYNTIRNSKHSGIYANGTGCNDAVIEGNNIVENDRYGVYTYANAQPAIHNNNFLTNSKYGVYNAGSVTIDAENNWWGDENGPENLESNGIHGDVDFDPWLTEEPNGNTDVEFNLNLKTGWNLISLPVVPDDSGLSTLFPDAEVGYEFQDGGYVYVNSLEPGKGYWIKMPSDKTYTITGQNFSTYTLTLSPGWHLAGAVNAQASPSTTPDGAVEVIYEYSNGAYNSINNLNPGYGYWVKIKQQCEFSLGD
ncbi:Big-1 domain-containing protein [Candidatus Magnetomoraceae bacterium gMMP-13]